MFYYFPLGVSASGFAVLYFSIFYPEIFSNVFIQVGDFHSYSLSLGEEEDWLVSHIAKIEKLPLKFVIHGSNYDYPFLARARRHLRDVLIAKGYDTQYYEYLGGHMYMGFAMNHSFSQGLIYLLNNK